MCALWKCRLPPHPNKKSLVIRERISHADSVSNSTTSKVYQDRNGERPEREHMQHTKIVSICRACDSERRAAFLVTCGQQPTVEKREKGFAAIHLLRSKGFFDHSSRYLLSWLKVFVRNPRVDVEVQEEFGSQPPRLPSQFPGYDKSRPKHKTRYLA